MNSVVNKLMSHATQAALWTMRRYDYHINGSLIRLNNPDHYNNPYKTYNALRERGHVMRSAANRGWIVTGHDEITELLRDSRISSDARKSVFLSRLLKFASAGIDVPLLDNPTMLNQDPPDHTRLRKLVTAGFVHKYIQSLSPTIERLVDELLDKIPDDASKFDVMDILAKPLPAIVIAEMMGVPVEDRHYFENWSAEILGVSEISNPEAIYKAATANQEMRDYIAGLAESKRHQPGQDLISMLIAAEEDGDRLTLEELYSTCILLLIAGHETTTRLIGNCLFQLLHHPDQMAMVRSDESLLMNALEETLRYEPPVQLIVRFINEDMIFHEKEFKKGQMLLISIAGANRDPIANNDPNTFDVTRKEIKHLSFGHGIHLCLGMTLARLEAKIVFTKLFEKYPHLSYKDEANWGTNDFFRGPNTLIVGDLSD